MFRNRLSTMVFIVGVFSVVGAEVCAEGALPLVSVDASELSEGPLAVWENAGSLKGSFKNDGTSPEIKVVDGVKAVVFSGDDYMLADFKAPAGITGDKPFTCFVKTYSLDTSMERTLVSWSNRPGNCLEIEYGDAALWGALGTWSAYTTGWGDPVPAMNKWHTLVYTYQGGREGEFQAWSDGDLRISKKMSLETKPDRPFVLGACMTGGDNPNDQIGYTHQINGALASVKIYDRAMSQVEIWRACGYDSAYQAEPKRDVTLDDISATLKWAAGNPDTASFDVYVGTDKAAVERAENTQPAGKADDWKNVYKGSFPATAAEYGPLALNVGTDYYWRVDQRNPAAFKEVQRGMAAKFSSPSGNASDPNPADGYIIVEGGKKILTWKPGKFAVKQNVYIGESAESVLSAKAPSIAGLPATATSADFPIKNPEPGKSYFWRVESVNRDKLAVSPGAVWSFRPVSKKLEVYLSAGQSNAVGCSSVKGIPDNLKGEQKNVIIFVRGECRLGEYGWAYLKDGLGSGFGDRDGKGTIGPELTFGVNMAPTRPDEVIAIIKCAWGGTNLGAQWRPPSAGGETGPLYKGFVEAVHAGMAALDPAFEPKISGMIWMQGESDSGDQKMSEDYAKNLTCLINDIRAEIKTPDMPFVLAQISKAPAWDNPPNRGPMIRAAESEVAKTVPHTATFPTDDYGMCDPWHYDTPGMVSLGERFADAMKTLEKEMTKL
jgi:alpha-galactosidase